MKGKTHDHMWCMLALRAIVHKVPIHCKVLKLLAQQQSSMSSEV